MENNRVMAGLVLKSLKLLSWGMLFGLAVYDIFLLYQYAFDLPFWDVWDNLPHGNFRGIFNFYNENLQLFYNIISEIMYLLTDWNLRYFAFVNFVIYLCAVGVYIFIVQKSETKLPLYPLFFLPLFSPILGYNWLWSILVQTHTYILFFLLAIYWGFCKKKNNVSQVLFLCCLVLSVLSMNIPLALSALIAYMIKEIINTASSERKKIIKEFIYLTGAFSIFLVIIWGKDDARVLKEVQFDNVWSMNYINNLSFYIIEGLGLFSLTDMTVPKYCPILFVVLLIFLGVAFEEQYKDKKKQALWAIIFCVMFNVCCVVALRHGEVYSYRVGFIRHHETLFLLFPAILLVLLTSRAVIVKAGGVAVLCVMLYGVVVTIKEKQFQFFGELFYKNACVCLNHYYNLKTISEWECTMNFPIPVDERIEYAKKHNLSFFENIKRCR